MEYVGLTVLIFASVTCVLILLVLTLWVFYKTRTCQNTLVSRSPSLASHAVVHPIKSKFTKSWTKHEDKRPIWILKKSKDSKHENYFENILVGNSRGGDAGKIQHDGGRWGSQASLIVHQSGRNEKKDDCTPISGCVEV